MIRKHPIRSIVSYNMARSRVGNILGSGLALQLQPDASKPWSMRLRPIFECIQLAMDRMYMKIGSWTSQSPAGKHSIQLSSLLGHGSALTKSHLYIGTRSLQPCRCRNQLALPAGDLHRRTILSEHRALFFSTSIPITPGPHYHITRILPCTHRWTWILSTLAGFADYTSERWIPAC
ncbi:peptidase family C54 protein [Verticillium alfalfae VaMs.102]|uniref:Peptidase family C54 protein n=1 Tax=Verticillium alfalfae (strain VaMs.102 / ATCC MYA-4576 / FGSC 10136) TaxID=526221 RepID=C9SXQ1_VERA1|nr:peptidase family C54 protein [Verticillium alfalfae VaMs.102]EEY23566.1 peptidase family C54 protein [Verticillium alfalfae VaMs.102]